MTIADLEIVPIFNQDIEICRDFARIETLCAVYSNHNECSGVSKDLYQTYFNKWNEEKNVFAFGVYHKKQMIGFSLGYVDDINENYMYLDSLYVEPMYQYFGIGTKLLQLSERVASIITQNIELFPLTNATDFYCEKHGYSYYKDSVCLVKRLPQTTTGVVPVFEWCDTLNTKLKVNISKKVLKENKPLFVYIGKDQNIDGVALRLPNGENKIKLNNNQRKFSKYRRLELADALNRVR